MKKLTILTMMFIFALPLNNCDAIDWKFWDKKYHFDQGIYGCWEQLSWDGRQLIVRISENGKIIHKVEKPKATTMSDTLFETGELKYKIIGDNTIELKRVGGIFVSLVSLFVNGTDIAELRLKDKDTLIFSSDDRIIFKRCQFLKYETSLLRIVSNVLDGIVTINNKNYGDEPLTVRLPNDKYLIVVQKEGFNDYKQSIDLKNHMIVEAILTIDNNSKKTDNYPKSIIDGIKEHLEESKNEGRLMIKNSIESEKIEDLREKVKKVHKYQIKKGEIIVLAEGNVVFDDNNLIGLSEKTLFTDTLLIHYSDIKLAYPDKGTVSIRLRNGELKSIPIRLLNEALYGTVKAINQGVFLSRQQ